MTAEISLDLKVSFVAVSFKAHSGLAAVNLSTSSFKSSKLTLATVFSLNSFTAVFISPAPKVKDFVTGLPWAGELSDILCGFISLIQPFSSVSI